MRSKFLKIIVLTVPALALLLAFSIIPQLELPAPTGPYAVGQTVFRWVDNSRPEVMTDVPDDFREVNATIWYPAEPGTGTKSPYFSGLSKVDARFRACLNFDGLQRGGPFSMEETALLPEQPFIFITKESELPQKLIERIESMSESYWLLFTARLMIALQMARCFSPLYCHFLIRQIVLWP